MTAPEVMLDRCRRLAAELATFRPDQELIQRVRLDEVVQELAVSFDASALCNLLDGLGVLRLPNDSEMHLLLRLRDWLTRHSPLTPEGQGESSGMSVGTGASRAGKRKKPKQEEVMDGEKAEGQST